MGFTIDKAGSHSVIAFEGDLDSAEVQMARGEVEALIGEGKPLVFDLSAVEFIDSSGIGLIVHAFRALSAKRSKVAICGASDQPLELLKATQLDRFMAFSDSPGEARIAVGVA
ncbi:MULTISPECIES: STAS domain-containing protein [Thalassobaculum]|uniref:Anti-sigma factor antagonist n=1 Tax=Thalassobaculum litoreum DSM 18839 TaxID=1123362 RepID=A0A8G2BG02_9PROT|nr:MULTISPECIES: STAS domain-containing protein [Thalassobaculum]SDF05208.1 anti-sigma B factor antagonist [Thalassobaculum litoreum DSM 18839]